ncbi:hydroxypyruvate isomerase [Aestuariivirga litoralis]|uniref:Hydroxypyruvate isomerase n=1 Tax=Aestuariivirga litoralis TaxID=2650924 RepID=A0A2W2ARG1_9HYPH|nr:2-oxo-tetronate isomerase [Aestuariivirga litoralis]PZF77951.1 hydroxypyruvate isomerase [Aestuariivirga litoralis]
MPKFAANLSMMFNEWEFLDRFAAAADNGFAAVEFLFPYAHAPDEIARRLAASNLTQALFNLPPGDWDRGDRGMACQPERADEFRASVAQALPYASATGVRRLHLMSGHGDRRDAAALEAYKAAIRHACAAAAPLGIDILIEPINGRDMPGYFLNDFGFAAGLIAELDPPNLRLQYDIYHRQILHGDVMKSLEALMPVTGHVQVASVPRRHEPGTGELDDARIFRHLDELGYAGYVGCEYRPAAGTVAGLGWFRP